MSIIKIKQVDITYLSLGTITNTDQIVYWTGTEYKKTAAADLIGTGTVSNVGTGGGLIGGPITSTGTISLDIDGQIPGTLISTDELIYWDVTNSAFKKTTVADINALSGGAYLPLAGGTMTGIITLRNNHLSGFPDLNFTSDLDTGVYSPVAGQVGLVSDGNERLRVETTQTVVQDQLAIQGIGDATIDVTAGSNILVIDGTGALLIPVGTTLQEPSSPVDGMIRFDSDVNAVLAYYSGTWNSLGGGGGGSVTSVATGGGLTGGPITATGTISLDITGQTAGTIIGTDELIYWNGTAFRKTTAQDIADLASGGGTVTSVTVAAGSTKLSSTGSPITTSGTITLDVVEANLTLDNIGGTLSVSKGGTGLTTITANSILYGNGTSAVNLITAPTVTDTYLKWDGSAFVWVTVSGGSGGTVTNVATGGGLTGGPITTTGTIALDITGQTSGTPIAADELIYWDTVSTSFKKTTVTNLVGTSGFNGFADGTNVAPGAYFTAQPTLGFYRDTTDQITWVNSSGEYMKLWLSGGNAQVSIKGGTGSMVAPESTSYYPSLTLDPTNNNPAYTPLAIRGASAQSNHLVIFTDSGNSVVGAIDNSAHFLAPAGNTTNPSYSFLQDNTTGLSLVNAGQLSFVSAGREIIRVDPLYGQTVIAANGSIATPEQSSLIPSLTTIPLNSGYPSLQIKASSSQTADNMVVTDSGNTVLSSIGPTGKFKAPDGTISAPGYTFLSDLSAGISTNAGKLSLSTATFEAIRIHPTYGQTVIGAYGSVIDPQLSSTLPSLTVLPTNNTHPSIQVKCAAGQSTDIFIVTDSGDTVLSSIGPTGKIKAPDGTISAPGYTFLSDPSAGISTSAGKLSLSTATFETMRAHPTYGQTVIGAYGSMIDPPLSGNLPSLTVLALNSSNPAIHAKAAPGQTTSIVNFTDSGDTVLSSIGPTGKFIAPDGTIGAPGYTFLSDLTAGLSTSAGKLSLSTATFEAIRIHPTYGQTVIGAYGSIADPPTVDLPSLTVVALNSGNPGMHVRGAPGQTTNLVHFTDSGDTVLSAIGPTGKFIAPDGTIAAPGYAFISDLTTGLSTNAGSLVFSTAGSSKMVLASGLTMEGATGGDQGTGTINATNLYINGVPVTAGGVGSVTSVATGGGLTGGPITTTGTVSLDITGQTAGTITGTDELIYWNGSAFRKTTAQDIVVSAGGTLIYRLAFTNADLSAGILTATHGLNNQYCQVTVYDNSNNMILPDFVTATSTTVVTIDLTSYGTITGTYNLVVVG